MKGLSFGIIIGVRVVLVSTIVVEIGILGGGGRILGENFFLILNTEHWKREKKIIFLN